MTSDQIRRQFIDFFVQKHGHTFVPSSPVVPHDDPTLLFTNAGMNQFKPIFLGMEKRPYTRAANTQKCIRAGGKHNDLDDVGRSRRHHTFFEMLGNWSFGDYFKEGAIQMAWELLTKVWKLDPTRLHVSCYEGNESAGIPRDKEAADLWKKIAGVPDDHIHYFGKDNFWEMGDTGPCGPCTEIYIDRTPNGNGGSEVNGEDPRVMEIWNLVFIQYNRDASGKLTPLPAQHVDTGMGFERICQVIQGKDDNYATDLWEPLFDRIRELSGITYTGQFTKGNATDPVAEAANPQLRHDIAFRVVADHVRCLTFAVTDGAVPSNEGRGYVLRRILRRAVRFGRQQLGLREPFMHKLVPVVVSSMGEAFPELKKNPGRVEAIVREEEASFARTLDRGIDLHERVIAAMADPFPAFVPDMDEVTPERERATLDCWDTFVNDRGARTLSASDSNELHFAKRTFAQARSFERRTGVLPSAVGMLTWKRNHRQMPGDFVFALYDSHGFPPDLTQLMAAEKGLTVDMVGYDLAMQRARQRARGGEKEAEFPATYLPPAAIAQLENEGVRQTDDSAKFTSDRAQGTVVAIWEGVAFTSNIAEREYADEVAIVLDRTNFYSEMGGQIGDSGEFITSDGSIFIVRTTRSVGHYVLHVGRLVKGSIKVGEMVATSLSVARGAIQANHTATHIANWALREVLGEGVQQKGSLVDSEKLRFDFSHDKSMSNDEIERVESFVARAISRKLPVDAKIAPQEKALKINGLRAVFGEKYPPMVRVVSVGIPVAQLLEDPENPAWREYSIEFCGGTHLADSGQAGAFVVMSEESVSKGIRRIVALTGRAADEAQAAARDIQNAIREAGQAKGTKLPPAIASLSRRIADATLPLRDRRRALDFVAKLQGNYKAFEKSQAKESSGGSIDVATAAGKLLGSGSPLGPGTLIIGEIPGASDDQLRGAIDSLKKKVGSYGILLAAAMGEKVTFIAVVSDDLIAIGLKAGDWVKEAAKAAGGGGGGRPQMAQAGGKDPSKLPEALRVAREFATRVVNQSDAKAG